MKKIGLLCLALVLALGTLGIGFAAWTDTVVINQTVETGSLSISLSKILCSEVAEFQGKDVGSIDCYLTGEVKCQIDYAGVLRNAYEKAEVVMLNAYPC